MDPVGEVLEGRVVGDRDARGRPRVQTTDFGPSKTDQSQADQADIKFILSKYSQIQLAASLNAADARFGDISEFTDYRDMVQQMDAAEEEFRKLPSKTREIFNHSVWEFLDAAEDPDKRQLLIDAGFIPAPEVPPAPTVEDPAPAPPSE